MVFVLRQLATVLPPSDAGYDRLFSVYRGAPRDIPCGVPWGTPVVSHGPCLTAGAASVDPRRWIQRASWHGWGRWRGNALVLCMGQWRHPSPTTYGSESWKLEPSSDKATTSSRSAWAGRATVNRVLRLARETGSSSRRRAGAVLPGESRRRSTRFSASSCVLGPTRRLRPTDPGLRP